MLRLPRFFAKKLPPELQTKSSAAAPMLAFAQLGRAQWTPRHYDRLADEGYGRNVIAYRCIKEISSSAAAVTLLLYQGSQEIEQHPVLSLLHRPNPAMGRVAFFEALYTHLLIAGNTYIEAIGEGSTLHELWPLRPDRMRVIPSRHGVPAAYEYTVNGQRQRWHADPLHGQSPILHVKLFHPIHDWYGQSPMEAAAYAIDQFNAACHWNQALLQNGARPSGALMVETDKNQSANLSEEQFNRLKQELDNHYSGAANAGRPILLEGGLKWVDMMLSPKDMDFITMKNSAARDIALAFGYPPMLLGIQGDNTYSNQKEARLALWEQTILPLVRLVLDGLSHWLLHPIDADLHFAVDEDTISALHPRREALWQRVAAADFLTNEEKREMLGF